MIYFLKDFTFSPVIVCMLCLGLTYALDAGRWSIPWKALSVVLIIGLLITAAAYLILPVLEEDCEVVIGAIAALAMRGLPVYPSPGAPGRYILLYGPLTYLAHIPLYAIFGTNLVSFKLLGALGFVATLVGLYGICRRFAEPTPSLIGCGCACVVLLRYVPIPFWGRIDSLLLGVIAVAYWIALRARRRLVVVVSTALAMGIVTNLKFSAPFYLLPLLYVVWIERGRMAVIAALLLGALLMPLPFLLPGVSFSNYLYIIGVIGRHGLDLKILLRNFQYVPVFLAPVFLLYFTNAARRDSERKQKTFYLALITCCMAISCFFGAKMGSGSYHLLPYSIPLLHLYFWIRASLPSTNPDLAFARYAAAWVLAILVFSSAQVLSLARCFHYASRGAEVSSQIADAEITYRGSALEVGVGNDFTDPRTLYVFIPVFDGQPYTLSSCAIRDLQLGGVELPQSTMDYFKQCKTPVWLIPSGQKPFTALDTYYSRPRPAFSDKFRSTFLNKYKRVSTGPQFDTWVCKDSAFEK